MNHFAYWQKPSPKPLRVCEALENPNIEQNDEASHKEIPAPW